MKRAICLITVLLLALLPVSGVYAGDSMEVGVLVVGDRVVVSGNAEVWEDTDVSLMVLNPGKNVSELTEDNVMEIVKYQNQTEADVDGKFVFEFDMDGEHGIYSFFIEVSGYKLSYSGSFEYFGSRYVAELLEKINVAKAENDENAVKELIEGNLLPLNINDGHYREYIAAQPGSTEIYRYAIKNGATAGGAELKKQLDEAALLLCIKHAADGEKAYAAIGAFMSELFPNNCVYQTLSDTTVLNIEQRNEICRGYIGRDLYSAAAFLDAFSESVILTAANTAESYGELQRVLVSNKEAIGFLNMTDYETLGNKEKVFIELFGTEFSGLADIREKVDAAITAEKNRENGGGSGGGIGGGSGGTKGSSGGGGFSSGGKAAAIDGLVPSGGVNANGDGAFADMDGFEWAKEAVDFLYGKKIINGTDSNHFNPGGFVTREEFLKMAVTAFNMYDETAEVNFDDVTSDDWFYRFVASAAKNGIVNGVSNVHFGTGEKIVREDMSVILYRAARAAGYSTESGTAEFTDSALMPDYAAEAVGALTASGVIQGMEDGNFGFGKYATRAEAAVVIYRLLKTAMTA